MATIRIPTPLRKFTNGADSIEVDGSNVREILNALENNHPGIRERICDNSGQVRRFVNVFVSDEDIRFLDNLDTPIKPGDEVSIIPAIAGG